MSTEICTPEPEIISPTEKNFRKCASMAYRFVLATIVSFQWYDFLFSPVWMHGYLWSLNQPIDVDLSDKSAGFIIDRQLRQCGIEERAVHAVLMVVCVYGVLLFADFNAQSTSNSWRLFRLSVLIGIATGTGRCLMLQQRLLSALHDGFFSYFHFFFVALCLTLQLESDTSEPIESVQSSTETIKKTD